jgi:hypothetical protein
MSEAYCVSLGSEVVIDAQAVKDHAVNSAPAPLPTPALLRSRSLIFDVRPGFLGGKRLLALWATWKASFQEPAATRAILEIRLHLCGYFRLNVHFTPAGHFLLQPERRAVFPHESQ